MQWKQRERDVNHVPAVESMYSLVHMRNSGIHIRWRAEEFRLLFLSEVEWGCIRTGTHYACHTIVFLWIYLNLFSIVPYVI